MSRIFVRRSTASLRSRFRIAYRVARASQWFLGPCLPAVSAFAQTPAPSPVVAPQRIGITGTASITLRDAIEKVLANDQTLVIARINQTESVLNLSGAKGAYDPRAGFTAGRTRSVTPVGSLFGGAADGKLTTETYQADPQISGL